MEIVNNKSRGQNQIISLYYHFNWPIGYFSDDSPKKVCKLSVLSSNVDARYLSSGNLHSFACKHSTLNIDIFLIEI